MFIFKKIKISVLISFTLITMFLLVFKSHIIIDGISNGINISINTLIPSLFPFIVLSCFIVFSNCYIYIGYLFYPLTKFVFKIPSFLGSIIFLGLIGGFPVGAKNIATLYEQKKINKQTANLLLGFCINAGPSFIVTGVGIKMLNSFSIGVALFISSTLSSLIIGVILMRRLDINSNNELKKITLKKNNMSLTTAFCESVNVAVKSMASICSFVVVFCGLISLITSMNIENSILKSILLALLEVTYSCSFSAFNNTYLSLTLICFSISFCGLSVIFQIKHILKDCDLSLQYFYFTRIPHFILSYIIFVAILYFSPSSSPVFSPSDIVVTGVSTNSFYGILFLVFSIITLLFSLENSIKKIRSNV